MTRTITGTNGREVVVDDEDADLAGMGWFIEPRGYAHRGENGRTTYLHRKIAARIFGDDWAGKQVDHINRDPTDNRRSNIRLATHGENLVNSKKRKDGRTSSFKGVCWHRASRRWRAYMTAARKQRSLGYFDSEIQAAEAYDAAAGELWGDFARLNLEREGGPR